VFGTPLKESLKYASLQISTSNTSGELYVWGYIPIVVAQCGLYLKENATEIPGTFSVAGSDERMEETAGALEAPPRYGKHVIAWKQESYTTASPSSTQGLGRAHRFLRLRKYLTQLPEPVIPRAMYHAVRHSSMLIHDPAKQPFDQDEVIATYKRLIRSMPRANQYLLLYILDLLSVFARKSDKNFMTARALAIIFRPGLLGSHPAHKSSADYDLSERVLEFLIAQQDWEPFALGGAWNLVSGKNAPTYSTVEYNCW
ncbi:Rho GTPase activation protein, partial [Mycena olivaceomarginata]